MAGASAPEWQLFQSLLPEVLLALLARACSPAVPVAVVSRVLSASGCVRCLQAAFSPCRIRDRGHNPNYPV